MANTTSGQAKSKPARKGVGKLERHELFCGRFIQQRGRKGAQELSKLQESVFFSLNKGCTDLDRVLKVISLLTDPIKMDYLPKDLGANGSPRGYTCGIEAYRIIDEVASNYDDLYWWFTEKGLRMDFVHLARAPLSKADQILGELAVERWEGKRLGKGMLIQIAKQLDHSKALSLQEVLSAATCKKLEAWRDMKAKDAPRTFESICKSAEYRRAFQRRLYRSRQKFMTTQTI